MKKKSVYLILLQSGFYLAVATFGIKSLAAMAAEAVPLNQAMQNSELVDKHGSRTTVNKFKKTSIEKLSPGKVWVLENKEEVIDEAFTWVVNDTKKAAQQPLLQLNKEQKKPAKKPAQKPKTVKKDSLKAFDKVTKDT